MKGVSGAKQMRKRLTRRMEQWVAGMIAELVQDTVASRVGRAKPFVDNESIAQRYHSMVIEGKLRAAVRSLMNRDGGGNSSR